MFLYEKNGKLNFQFGSGQLPTPTPTLELDKKELRIGSTIIPESGEIVTKAYIELVMTLYMTMLNLVQ